MKIEKYCIMCGSINNTRSKNFCSEKCKQHHYYLDNLEKRKEYKVEHYKSNKNQYKENRDKWYENNREKWNNYMKEYYHKRKEGNNE